MKARAKWWLAGIVFVLVLCGLAAWWGIHLRERPEGAFYSYSMLPHATKDVLEFSGGVVTWRTCCFDEDRGTYERSQSGDWIWNYRPGADKPVTMHLILNPGALYLTAFDSAHPSTKFTLRRRLSEKFSF